MFGYKTAIPSALQRNDLLSRVDTVVLIGRSLVQIAFLLLADNFYFYLLTSLAFTVLRNFLISHLVERCYPQYVCRGSIDVAQFVELKRLVGGLSLSKFRAASRHMIDSLCITVFVNLTLTAIYSNYFLIHSAVTSLFGIICTSMMASVGNSIATESVEKNYRDMRRFNFMYMLLADWAVTCMLCLYQPFVQLWMDGALTGSTVAAGGALNHGSVNAGGALAQAGVAAGEALMLGWPEVVALCLYFYVLRMGDVRWIYFEGAGLWWKARYIAIAEIIANIVLNIVLAKFCGVLGIIVATLISLFFINFIGEAWILFKEYFKNGRLSTFFADQALYFGVTVVLAVACLAACEGVGLPSIEIGAGIAQSKLFALAGLARRLLICTSGSVAGYYLAFGRSERYRDAKNWILSRYRGMRKGE